MLTATPYVVINFTAEAEEIARLAVLSADHAFLTASLASGLAYDTHQSTSSALFASQNRVSSPVKAKKVLPSSFGASTTNSSPNATATATFSSSLKSNKTSPFLQQSLSQQKSPSEDAVVIQKHANAIEKLASGAVAIEFPPTALENDLIKSLCEALKGNQTLTHLSLQKAIPTTYMVENVIEALQGNQSLTYLNLSQNLIGNVKAEEQNLTGLQKIKRLIDECETLKYLDISFNDFGSPGLELVCQGVRESISLTSLDLSGNQVNVGPEGDDEAAAVGLEALKEILTKHKFLHHLSLRENALTQPDMEVLTDALKATTKLTSLNLANNKLQSPGATTVAAILKENRGLTSLDLSGNIVGWKGIVALCDAVVSNTTLVSLSLQRECFGTVREKRRPPGKGEGEEENTPADPEEEEAKRKEIQDAVDKKLKCSEKATTKIAEMLQSPNATLTALDISFNQIGGEHMAIVASALKQNTSLLALACEMNYLCGTIPGEYSSAGIEAFEELLKVNTTLQSLNLKWNFLQYEGAKRLSGVLPLNQTLTALDISRNFLRDDGMEIIVGGLLKNQSIQVFVARNNEFTKVGAQKVAKLLQKSTLRVLDISENAITAEGFNALADALLYNSALREIDLSCCEVSQDCVKTLAMVLATNTVMEKFIMADNPINVEVIEAAISSLKQNQTLKAVSIWGRGSTTTAAVGELAVDLLKENTTLTYLDLGFSKVPLDVMAEVSSALRKNMVTSLSSA